MTHNLVENLRTAIEASAYTVTQYVKWTGKSSMYRWLSLESKPSPKSEKFIEELIMKINQDPKRIPFHPSWGYATQEQIERLKQPIHEAERARIMEQIKKQTQLRGKVK